MSPEGEGARPAPSVADRLRSLRAATGWSQEELARHLGVSFATVSRWERARTSMSPGAALRLSLLESGLGPSAGSGLPRRSGRRTPPSPSVLPALASSFVGRRVELEDLAAIDRTSRLLCLTGPGGVGKTRLALEFVRRCADPPCAFVSLANVTDERGLWLALAASLGVRERGGVSLPSAVESALAAGPRRLLLDRAEHVRQPVAGVAARLLALSGDIRVLVTSRWVLGLTGETVWVVPPLTCPGEGDGSAEIFAADAVALWVERARERRPGYDFHAVPASLLAELCSLVDGLPGAIELLAGWAGSLSVAEIVRRRSVLLDEVSPAGAFGAVIQQSWELLEPVQREQLPLLTLFAAPFTIAGAAALVHRQDADVARFLRSLVDSSWLTPVPSDHETRFAMLDSIRSFLEGRLDAEARRIAGARHGAHFLDLACNAEAHLSGPDVRRWVQCLDEATDDLDRALAWALEEGCIDAGLDASAALWRWWLIKGRLLTGRRWLDEFLRAPGRRDAVAAARAERSAALLAVEGGDYRDAITRADRALRTFRSYGQHEDAAIAATVIGSAQRYLGEAGAAEAAFGEALALRRALGDERSVSVSLNNLALLAMDAADDERALELFGESIGLKRRLGEPMTLAIGLSNLSTVLIRSGRLAEAGAVLDEAMRLAGDLGNVQLVGTIEASRGSLAAARDDWVSAVQHYREALVAQRTGGHAHDVVVALVGLGRALHRTGEVTAGLDTLEQAEAVAEQTGNAEGVLKVRDVLREMGVGGAAHPPGGLTQRQADVLRRLAVGAANKEIARELGVSATTVDRHVANIYRRLHVHSRVEATRWALAHDLAGAGYERRFQEAPHGASGEGGI